MMKLTQNQKNLLSRLLQSTNWKKSEDSIYKKSSDGAYGVEIKRVNISDDVFYFHVYFSTLQSYVIEKYEFNLVNQKLPALNVSTIQKYIDEELFNACLNLMTKENTLEKEESSLKESQLLDKFLAKLV